jgi:hypothetical protein
MFTNPGAEGTYSSGLAPSWGKGGTGTPSEENSIIHGGLAAQKWVGGASGSGVYPNSVTVTKDVWYLYSGWIQVDAGTGQLRRNNGYLANILLSKEAPTGGFVNLIAIDRANTTGVETIVGRQSGAPSATLYYDDASLKPLTTASMFATLLTRKTDVTVAVAVTLATAPTGGGIFTPGGVVVSLDNPANPLNYVLGYYYGTKCYLDKCVAGVYTNLIAATTTYAAGATVQVVKSGTTYQLFYNGAQVGANQTISDATVVNNTRHGMFSGYSGNTLDSFSAS